MKYPYHLIDSITGCTVCRYKSLSIACRDGANKNREAGGPRYYVLKIASGKRVAC
jgi:hypothetical protein